MSKDATSSGRSPEATTTGKARVAELEARARAFEHELARAQAKVEGMEAISRALGSEHDLERILQTVMAHTTELARATRSTLFILDEGTGVLWSKTTEGGDVETIYVQPGQGIAGWVAIHGRIVNVKDAYQDPRFDPAFDQETGFRTTSVVCAPLRDSQQRIIGVIQVLNKVDGYFSTADEDLIAAIAAQSAVSIQNSKLYLEVVGRNIDLLDTQIRLEERTAELELLFDVERAAATATSVDGALNRMVAATLRAFPCEACGVLLVDLQRDVLRHQCIGGPRAERVAPLTDAVGHMAAERVLQTGEAYVANGPPRAGDEGPEAALGRRIFASSEPVRVRNLACVPVIHQSERIGCLQLVNRMNDPKGFSKRDVRLLTMLGSRVALAIVIGRAMAEEQKAERLATIGQMLSGVLHDLKTPLTVIGGYAQLMVRESDERARAEYRELVRKQIGQLKAMTQELLAFARGETRVLLRKVFVHKFMAEISELLQEEFAGSGVSLVVEVAYRGAVRMDEQKMLRAISNLARNALEAMEGGGTFRIRVEEVAGRAVFTFADTGPGLAPEMEGRLFDSFATHGKKNGTGLGLAVVKKIVDEHSGEISATSRPGEGVTFTLSIPQE